MSLTITTDVFCDKCGDWTQGVSEGRPNGKQARAIAKSRGWKRIHADGKLSDLCPRCLSPKESSTPKGNAKTNNFMNETPQPEIANKRGD